MEARDTRTWQKNKEGDMAFPCRHQGRLPERRRLGVGPRWPDGIGWAQGWTWGVPGWPSEDCVGVGWSAPTQA